MLLNFKCQNFKSFKDGFEFEMQPEKRITDLSYSILTEEKIKALSASVIYGPNAAGKTSVINAMSCLKQIVLQGDIEDSKEDKTYDHISADMSLIPFRFSEEKEPVYFDISFTYHGIKYRYRVGFALGRFLEKQAKRYICCEQLYINDEQIFDRSKDQVIQLSLNSIKKYLNVGYDMSDVEKHRIAMSNNINPMSLLLVTDFYSFCSKALANEIKEWFEKYFIVVNASDKKKFYPDIRAAQSDLVIVDGINKIAKEAGIFGSDFAYALSDESVPKLISILGRQENKFIGINAELIESNGTMRLVSIMPAIISSLYHGSVLIVDELDASLHPMIVMNLITLFHNDEVNRNHAQLIFNTHNPIYLNSRLLRRDEIKFVERDKSTNASSLYALSDFKTNRKNSDYMKNYFMNRYGAIEDIDFTDIILEVLSNKGDLING